MSDRNRSKTQYRDCKACPYLVVLDRRAEYSPKTGTVRRFYCDHPKRSFEAFLGFVAIVEPQACPLEPSWVPLAERQHEIEEQTK